MLSINFGKLTEDNCLFFCYGYVNSSGKKIKGMIDWVFERKELLLDDTITNLQENSSIKKVLEELKAKLTKEEIKKILSCDYTKLKDKNDKYSKFDINFWLAPKTEVNLLEKIFNYSSFRNYKKTIINGYWLSEKLGIDCCPYCNRNYTSSHQTFFKNINNESKEKHVFPEFDHFYPKEEYKLLAISFYNLIPSCNICNTHFKGGRNPLDIFHPYKNVIDNHFSFIGFPNDIATLYGAGHKITLDFEYSCDSITKEELIKSIEFFGIKDTYEKCHSNLIEDIIYKKLAFSERYIKELQSTYKINFEDAYKILFEVHFEDDKLHKRPFSKLKKDIYKNF